MNKSKRKGTAFESAVVVYLNERGIPCRRVALAGVHDEGDVRSDNGAFIMECKAGAAADKASKGQIEAWLKETERERANASAKYGFLVLKTAGKGSAQAGAWRVVISAENMNSCWGSSIPCGWLTVNLDFFATWWLTNQEI